MMNKRAIHDGVWPAPGRPRCGAIVVLATTVATVQLGRGRDGRVTISCDGASTFLCGDDWQRWACGVIDPASGQGVAEVVVEKMASGRYAVRPASSTTLVMYLHRVRPNAVGMCRWAASLFTPVAARV